MNGVLVVLEHRGEWTRMSWEALAAGHALAAELNQPLLAAVAQGTGADLSPEMARQSAAKAYVVRHELLTPYTADGFTSAFEQLIRTLDPAFILFPHTYQVRDFVPRLATRFEQTLIADVIAFRIESGKPVFVRQMLQGKLNADYRHSGDGPGFVSVQAGAWRGDTLTAGVCEVEIFTPKLEAAQIRTRPEPPFRMSDKTVDLTSAPLIVSVGRGIKEKDNLPIVEAFAESLGAELAASRPICDNGWLPMERQVGSSGQTVSPKLYVAVGISGAIQHLVGMKGSKVIVAINKDENAPIFETADYGIVGDLFEVVPALTAAVRKARNA
jgi:electron transfer flavoprotein alpha subunit